MKFSVLIYNLDLNKAQSMLISLIEENKPDIIAVQEIKTSEQDLQLIKDCGYDLADYSNSFIKFNKIFGVATFYNPRLFTSTESASINLPFSIYEFFQFIFKGGRRQRTVLQTELVCKKNKKHLVIYNLHLSPFSTNTLRIKQLQETLQSLNLQNIPSLILGDFNYPYGRKKFEGIFNKYGLKEATYGIFHTFKSSFPFFPIKLKLDYILYQNLKHKKTKKNKHT